MMHGIEDPPEALSGADFSGANFTGADLRNAILDGVNFSGAKLDGIRLEGASLEGAKGLPADAASDRNRLEALLPDKHTRLQTPPFGGWLRSR
jgi:uncharacterized protein YjbI with pentapeptide repeats